MYTRPAVVSLAQLPPHAWTDRTVIYSGELNNNTNVYIATDFIMHVDTVSATHNLEKNKFGQL